MVQFTAEIFIRTSFLEGNSRFDLFLSLKGNETSRNKLKRQIKINHGLERHAESARKMLLHCSEQKNNF